MSEAMTERCTRCGRGWDQHVHGLGCARERFEAELVKLRTLLNAQAVDIERYNALVAVAEAAEKNLTLPASSSFSGIVEEGERRQRVLIDALAALDKLKGGE